MNAQRVAVWTQVVGGAAVILGLGLVVWELQQVKTLTRAQLTSDLFAISVANHDTVMGESAAAVLAKACTDPAELSLEESTILNHFYVGQLELVSRMVVLTDRDGLFAPDYWKIPATGYFATVFETAYGRAWFMQQDPSWYAEGVIRAGREFLASRGEPRCVFDYESIRERVISNSHSRQ